MSETHPSEDATSVHAFMMGEFTAEFPADRFYCQNHMWAKPLPAAIRFGFSAYAVRLLQDVYFLDWHIQAPAELRARQLIGSIESKKAESDLYAPCAGELTSFNDDLMADPAQINVDKYGTGWLFEMKVTQPLWMTPEEYLQHLASVWEVTQRTIKGQLN